ncbi:Cell wall integrity and stress response component 4 [Diatrype stigma]|uniref:Cell wall integrity and stress response component 4 n=1 Tax=Diatrype stigma TaxID=117547 RepID=A0AAN9ULI7_9PEZI
MAIMAGLASAQSIQMTYCANINTASSDASDGSAFAIIQGFNCWCSDFEPAESTQSDISECNKSCPGYPSDTCGGDGLYGYMAMGEEPSGTKGADSSTATATPTTKEVTTTVENGVTTTVLNTVTVGPTTSDEPITTTSTSTSSVWPTGGAVPGASTSSQQHQGADSSTSSQPTAENGGGITTGAAVGIAIGVLGFIAIIAALIVFFWLRRRRNEQEAMVERSNSGRGSSAGMMSTPRTEMASVWDSEQLSGNRRNSRIMPHDPRMDPFATNLYNRENKSHESINTIQDNHDYSRKVLRTTNPDPPADE